MCRDLFHCTGSTPSGPVHVEATRSGSKNRYKRRETSSPVLPGGNSCRGLMVVCTSYKRLIASSKQLGDHETRTRLSLKKRTEDGIVFWPTSPVNRERLNSRVDDEPRDVDLIDDVVHRPCRSHMSHNQDLVLECPTQSFSNHQGGRTYLWLLPPSHLSSSRVFIAHMRRLPKLESLVWTRKPQTGNPFPRKGPSGFDTLSRSELTAGLGRTGCATLPGPLTWSAG